MHRLLLCPPDFYSIRYEINPWMSRMLDAVHPLALAQWRQLHATLQNLGCRIELIEPQPGWPDMVFTANAGLTIGDRFVRANVRHEERAGEAPWFEQWFREHGFKVILLPPSLAFEGEGDALFCGGALFCGHAFRTDQAAHRALGDLLGCRIVSLKLVDPRYYHLDTCFCPLSDGAVIWHPSAFDEPSRNLVRAHVVDRIEVSSVEAMRFACNSIVLGNHIVLPDGCPQLRDALRERGMETHSVPMSEFIKAGGACKCLVLHVSAPALSPNL